jgi:hypothetical protein
MEKRVKNKNLKFSLKTNSLKDGFFFKKIPLIELKKIKADDFQFSQSKLQRCPKTAQTVDGTTDKINGRSLGEILGRTCNFGDFEPKKMNLRKHLVVEHKVIRIFFHRYGF